MIFFFFLFFLLSKKTLLIILMKTCYVSLDYKKIKLAVEYPSFTQQNLRYAEQCMHSFDICTCTYCHIFWYVHDWKIIHSYINAFPCVTILSSGVLFHEYTTTTKGGQFSRGSCLWGNIYIYIYILIKKKWFDWIFLIQQIKKKKFKVNKGNSTLRLQKHGTRVPGSPPAKSSKFRSNF